MDPNASWSNKQAYRNAWIRVAGLQEGLNRWPDYILYDSVSGFQR